MALYAFAKSDRSAKLPMKVTKCTVTHCQLLHHQCSINASIFNKVMFCCRWFTLEAAAGILKPNTIDYLGGRNLSQYLFDTAMASNISVIRFIGGSANDADEFKLQTAPGMVYIFIIWSHSCMAITKRVCSQHD